MVNYLKICITIGIFGITSIIATSGAFGDRLKIRDLVSISSRDFLFSHPRRQRPGDFCYCGIFAFAGAPSDDLECRNNLLDNQETNFPTAIKITSYRQDSTIAIDQTKLKSLDEKSVSSIIFGDYKGRFMCYGTVIVPKIPMSQPRRNRKCPSSCPLN